MWAGGKEVSESGEPVLLLEPSSHKPNKPQAQQYKKENADACSSFIGGTPIYFQQNDESITNQDNPVCDICKRGMHLLIQIYAPVDGWDRTMMVFGCNSNSCVQKAMAHNNDASSGKDDDSNNFFRFSVGGMGVIRCIRSQKRQQPQEEEKLLQQKEAAIHESKQNVQASTWDDDGGWGDPDIGGWGDDNDVNDEWGDMVTDNHPADGDEGGTKDASMDDLEAMLAAMESGSNGNSNSSNKKKSKSASKSNPITRPNMAKGHCDRDGRHLIQSFPKYDLEVYDEPIVSKRSNTNEQDSDSDDDDDDQGNTKEIESLLSKYLKEEDDTEILSAIQGSKLKHGTGEGGKAGSGSSSGEKYEKAPPEERAFLTFTNRVKRAPKQSARYAYGGFPLWSIPTPLTPKGKSGRQTRNLNFPKIPNCPRCGFKREFEFQIMPSILHILNVDQYANKKNINKDSSSSISQSTDGRGMKKSLDQIMSRTSGGMNWGTIAVYSCVNSCEYRDEEGGLEEFVVIQESADGNPRKREMKRVEEAANSEANVSDRDGAVYTSEK